MKSMYLLVRKPLELKMSGSSEYLGELTKGANGSLKIITDLITVQNRPKTETEVEGAQVIYHNEVKKRNRWETKGDFSSVKEYFYRMEIRDNFTNFNYVFYMVSPLKPSLKNMDKLMEFASSLFNIPPKHFSVTRRGTCKVVRDHKTNKVIFYCKPAIIGIKDTMVPGWMTLALAGIICVFWLFNIFMIQQRSNDLSQKLYEANIQIDELQTSNHAMQAKINELSARIGGNK